MHWNSRFLRAIGTMVGGIVGVGVFGLPYAFAQSGYVVGLGTLIIIGTILTVLQLMFAEVVMQTGGKHRIVGYIRQYLGENYAWLSIVLIAVTYWGVMTAYIIVGGKFLFLLLGPVFGGVESIYSILLAAIASYLTYRGLHFASRFEEIIVGGLLFLFTFMILAAAPHINASNLYFYDVNNLLFPYGVILFSFAGTAVVPEMRDILGKKQEKKLPQAILASMILIGLIYTFFILAVVGVTGANTTEIAFDGLIPVIGTLFRVVGALLGSLTILSIFTIIGLQLMNTFRYDFKVKRKTAWGMTVFVPLILFLLGLRHFIEIIGFIGGVLVAGLGIMLVFVYEKMRHSPICKGHKCFSVPQPVSFLIVLMFIVGAVLEVISRL